MVIKKKQSKQDYDKVKAEEFAEEIGHLCIFT